ncbi:MAG: hypothetical protein HUJ51_03670 [Eggerthellaceae bacterium]|nr:hypothetical protein [Eggerthellaceae bacterium]
MKVECAAVAKTEEPWWHGEILNGSNEEWFFQLSKFKLSCYYEDSFRVLSWQSFHNLSAKRQNLR